MNQVLTTQSMKIKRGDTVKVLRGKDRGKTGSVMAVFPKEGRVVVEKVNLVKKHVRPRRQGEKGQRVSVAAPMNVANVQLVCPQCKKPTRVGIARENGNRQRMCKKCNSSIDA